MRHYLNIDTCSLESENSYWTAREICEQPSAWKRSLLAIESHRSRIDRWLSPLLADADLRIVLAGAGSSSFVGATLAPWLTQNLHRRVDAVSTTDFVSHPTSFCIGDKPTLVISFARSGDSPESLATVRLADSMLSNCWHLAFTCNPDGGLAKLLSDREDSLCLFMPEGTNDQSFAMTSSYTSMLVSCAALFTQVRECMTYATRAAQQQIDFFVSRARELANRPFDRFIVLGAGCLNATAREAGLKCMELTNGLVIAMSDTPLGFRHGPKSVVDEQTCVVLLSSTETYASKYDLDLLAELCGDQKANTVIALSIDDHSNALEKYGSVSASSPRNAVTNKERIAVRHKTKLEIIKVSPADESIPSGFDDFWASLPYLVFCQMLAFFKSRALSISADNPCPTGEVNRVVQGVTIHPFSN